MILEIKKLPGSEMEISIEVPVEEFEKYYKQAFEEISKDVSMPGFRPGKVPPELLKENIDSEAVLKKTAELAQDISKRLKEGCDFAGLAKVYSAGPGASEGGDMGYVKKGDLMPEIEKAVFNLKEGETSDIIQTKLGYHIFMVEGKKPARMLTISEARRDIEEAIFREKVNQKISGWVEGLKKNAYIAFK